MKRTLAEGTAIVVSILLAFGVQAWWEGQRELDELGGMLALLDAEVARNVEALEVAIDAHRQLQAAIDAIDQAGSWHGVRNPFVPVEVFNPDDGALQALTASGLVGQIADLDLRVLISSLPGLVADLAEKESRAVARRELARNRVAKLGVRLVDNTNPPDHPFWSDTELLNLLTMRGTEETNVIVAAEVLLAHFERIGEKIAVD